MGNESAAEEHSAESPVDRFVDELLPEDLEWSRLAGTYPLATLAVAAAGGFWIGQHHGPALLRAASDFLSREMTRNVQDLFDGLAVEPRRSSDAVEPPNDDDF